MNAIDLGVAGAGEVSPGTHLCALYWGPEERDDFLMSFLEAGTHTGDKGLVLVDGIDSSPAFQAFIGGGDCPASCRQWLRNDLTPCFWGDSVDLSVDRMVTLLREVVVTSMEEHVHLVRAACEMSWIAGRPLGSEEFFRYESAVSGLVHDVPAVYLCLYDLRQLGVERLIEVLRTHPKVLLDGTKLENHNWRVTVDHDLHGRGGSPGVASGQHEFQADLWVTLTFAELRIAGLVARGMSNRGMAAELNLSRHTVDAHLKHIYTKLDIHSRVELTVLAIHHDLPS